MKKKNLLTAAASLALVGVIGAGATLAYFTSQTETVQNVFTTGNVNITLVDETQGPNKEIGDQWEAVEDENGGIHYTNVMPADDLSKKVGVIVAEGSSNCYAGIQVVVGGLDGEYLEDMTTMLAYKAETNGWLVDVEGNVMNCYYADELAAEDAVNLFETVTIPADWGNDFANTEFTVSVKAAAVQSANLEAPNADMNNRTVAELEGLFNAR